MKLIKYAGKMTIKRVKLDLIFSESGRLRKSRATHIRELTRFQRKISAGQRRSSWTNRNPGSPAPQKCMKSSRSFLYFAIYHSNHHLVGTVLAVKELSFSWLADFYIGIWRNEKFKFFLNGKSRNATFPKLLLIA